MLKRIIENYPEESFLKADGFDKAILGVDEKTMRLVYSVAKCIKVLMHKDKMTDIDAIEYFEFNVRGSYVGEQTPIWCDDNF